MMRYEIRTETGRQVDPKILKRFYGATWKSVLGRFNHRCDGYLFSIHRRNRRLRIYRILDNPPAARPIDLTSQVLPPPKKAGTLL